MPGLHACHILLLKHLSYVAPLLEPSQQLNVSS